MYYTPFDLRRATAACAVAAFALSVAPVKAEAKEAAPDIVQMARQSEYVAVIKAIRIDTSTETPQVIGKLIENWKGKVATPAPKNPKPDILVAAPNESDDGEAVDAKPWAEGNTYVVFITQTEQVPGATLVFTFRNLHGKILAEKNALPQLRETITAIDSLTTLDSPAAKTSALVKYLNNTKNKPLRLMAFQELQLRSRDYNLDPVAPILKAAIKDKDAEIRSIALMVQIRIHDQKNKGNKAKDMELYKFLLTALDDSDAKVRETAFGQLKSRSGQDLPFDAAGDAATRKEQVKGWAQWIEKAGEDLEIFGD